MENYSGVSTYVSVNNGHCPEAIRGAVTKVVALTRWNGPRFSVKLLAKRIDVTFPWERSAISVDSLHLCRR